MDLAYEQMTPGQKAAYTKRMRSASLSPPLPPGTLTMAEIVELAELALREHGLWSQGWRFEWDQARRRGGACSYRRKRITLSRPIFLIHANRDNALNVIMHEVAHALAGHAAGHGPTWQRIARSIGCDGKRCHSMDTPSRYAGTCECDAPHNRDRLDKDARYRCRRCGAVVVWTLSDLLPVASAATLILSD